MCLSRSCFDRDDVIFVECTVQRGGVWKPILTTGSPTYDWMTKSTRLSFSLLSFLSFLSESACAPTKNIRPGSI